MKLYTVKHEIGKPTPQQITVDTNSEYLLGFELKKNGEDITKKVLPEAYTLADSPANETAKGYNGVPCFNFKSGYNEEDKEITVNVSSDRIEGTVGCDNEYLVYKTDPTKNPSLQAWEVKKAFTLTPRCYVQRVSWDQQYLHDMQSENYLPFNATIIHNNGNSYDITDESFNGYPSTSFVVGSVYVGVDKEHVNYDQNYIPSQRTYWLLLENSAQSGKPFFALYYSKWDAPLSEKWPKSIVVDDTCVITLNSKQGGEFFFGTDAKTTIKARINENKTSEGDIDLFNHTNTVNLSGTYSDDTTFNFDVYVK